MKTGLNWKRLLAGLGIAVLQFISTQVVTFVVSLLIPIMNFPQNYPVIFTILLGLCFSTGVFLTGWLALKQGWLKAEPKLPARLAGTLIGAYLPLIVALLIVHPLGPNPWFFISMAVSVIGFHIPGFF